MRLALTTLADRLPSEFRPKLHHASGSQRLYGRPVLYEAGMPLENDVLYVTRGPALPDRLPNRTYTLICVGAMPQMQQFSAFIPILHVTGEASLVTVFNAVQAVFDACDQWDSSLRDELEKDVDFDIRRFLRVGTEFLGRSISIVNQNLQASLRSLIEEDTDKSRTVAVDSSITPLGTEASEQIKEVCRLERQLREPYFSALEINGKAYCNNLYPLGHYAGCASISEEGEPFRDGELPLIDHFFQMLQKAYLKHLQSNRTDEEASLSALHKLLSHAPLSQPESEQLTLAADELWRCFVLREKRGERSFPYDYMHATLNGIFPKTVYAVAHHQTIVGLIRVREEGLAVDSALLAFGDEVRRLGYYGGISNTFSDLGSLDSYLLQADYAADRGNGSKSPLLFFHDYVMSYMLDACCRELPVETLMGRGLRELLAYDKARGTQHVKTLDCYLRNECSASQTARELYVHRTSLLKRLEKIKQVLNDDLESPNHRLYYRVCLALMRRDGLYAGL